MTINKALTALVTKGFIRRVSGKGTFILDQQVTKYIGAMSPGSFSRDMESIHTKPGAILVDYRVIRASEVPTVAQQLELLENDFLHYIHRIRTSDGVRIALSHTYIPCKYLPAIDVSALEGSLYEYLDKAYHVHPQAQDYSFAALLPTNRQKDYWGRVLPFGRTITQEKKSFWAIAAPPLSALRWLLYPLERDIAGTRIGVFWLLSLFWQYPCLTRPLSAWPAC